MAERSGFLFDLDGVIIDSEPVYDIFWREAAIYYCVGIEHFEDVVKGTTMSDILEKYFSQHTRDDRDCLVSKCAAFETEMELPEVEGAVAFIELLKQLGYKVGLVTSSELHKLNHVFDVWPIKAFFDTIVTAERVVCGKPSPECYLLAANELGLDASECFVFEDSMNGIKAGNAAGARVIGVTTSHLPELLKEITFDTIGDFRNIDAKKIKRWERGRSNP